MADFYIITRYMQHGSVQQNIYSGVQYTSAQVKTLQQQLHAEGGVKTTVYREVTETVANQVILTR